MKMPSLQKKIREMLHEYYRGSGCNPMIYEIEEEVLEGLGEVAQKIRQRIAEIKGWGKAHENTRIVVKSELGKVLALLVEQEGEK